MNMPIAVVTYEDGDVVVSRRGEDDTVLHLTIDQDDEDWSNSGRIGFIEKTAAGYRITIAEGFEYDYGTYPTLQEAVKYTVSWVGCWPDGWCDAHFGAASSAMRVE
jgi:hypothetical protein